MNWDSACEKYIFSSHKNNEIYIKLPKLHDPWQLNDVKSAKMHRDMRLSHNLLSITQITFNICLQKFFSNGNTIGKKLRTANIESQQQINSSKNM